MMVAPAKKCDVSHTITNKNESCKTVSATYGTPITVLNELNPTLNLSELCRNPTLPTGLHLCVHNITMDEYRSAGLPVETKIL